MKRLALEKENSATIGFVVSCVFASAIDLPELRAWADHVLVTTDSCPVYIVDLSTFDDSLFHILRVIGFVPGSGLDEEEEIALVGIAFARGREQFEPKPTKQQALAALAAHPDILLRFHDTFPFINVQRDSSTRPK